MKVKGLDVRPEFEALLNEGLNDKTKIRLPGQIAISALKSLELSEHIESNLECSRCARSTPGTSTLRSRSAQVSGS